MVALLVDIRQFVIRLHKWLVAPVCEVEGHIKKVDDLFVSFDCDFKAIQFEHWQTPYLFFQFLLEVALSQANFIFELILCYQGQYVGSY